MESRRTGPVNGLYASIYTNNSLGKTPRPQMNHREISPSRSLSGLRPRISRGSSFQKKTSARVAGIIFRDYHTSVGDGFGEEATDGLTTQSTRTDTDMPGNEATKKQSTTEQPAKDLLLGAHMSVAGGLDTAFERIRKVHGTALQIFTRNQRTWKDAPLDEAEVEAFRTAWAEWGPYPVASHASYLINLASPKPEIVEKSVASLAREIYRCARLGVADIVLHPGAPQETGPEAGIAAVARGLDAAFSMAGEMLAKESTTVHAEPNVLLEITAGQGSTLGSTFAELAAIIAAAKNEARLGICVDTCHAFAAGYDLATSAGLAQTLAEMDAAGLRGRLGLLHLNDSKTELGSRKDRHIHIGEGFIGVEGFAGVVKDPYLRTIPMVIEMPKGENLEFDFKNLGLLRELAGIAEK